MAKAKLPTADKLLDITKSEKPKKLLVIYEDGEGVFQVAACKGVTSYESARRLLQKAAERIG